MNVEESVQNATAETKVPNAKVRFAGSGKRPTPPWTTSAIIMSRWPTCQSRRRSSQAISSMICQVRTLNGPEFNC